MLDPFIYIYMYMYMYMYMYVYREICIDTYMPMRRAVSFFRGPDEQVVAMVEVAAGSYMSRPSNGLVGYREATSIYMR